MKRLMLASVAMVLTAGAAMAADLSVPFKAAPVMVAPVYNWTGCYLGINGGGAAFRDQLTGTWSDGGLVGGQVGCNYQIDHLVVGVEGEGMWSGVSSSQTFQGFAPAAVAATTTFKNSWDADIAIRFGLAYDRFFIYQKIGAVWGDHQVTTSNIVGAATTTTGTATLPGLLWGLGLEYGLTAQWTAKVETDFVHYAGTNMSVTCSSTVAAAGCGGAVSGVGTTSENSFAVITKVGLNYRF